MTWEPVWGCIFKVFMVKFMFVRVGYITGLPTWITDRTESVPSGAGNLQYEHTKAIVATIILQLSFPLLFPITFLWCPSFLYSAWERQLICIIDDSILANWLVWLCMVWYSAFIWTLCSDTTSFSECTICAVISVWLGKYVYFRLSIESKLHVYIWAQWRRPDVYRVLCSTI